MRWMVLDGVDATGKTTLCAAIADHYRQQGKTCRLVDEFSSCFVGRGIFDIVSAKRFFRMNDNAVTPIADLMVYLADVFCKYEIEANVSEDIVVMERGIISVLGYQVVRLFHAVPEALDGDFGERLFECISAASRYTRWPDCHFTLKIEMAEMSRRIEARNELALTGEQMEIFDKIQRRMLAVGPRFRAIDVVVDDRSIEQLVAIIVEAFERRTAGRA